MLAHVSKVSVHGHLALSFWTCGEAVPHGSGTCRGNFFSFGWQTKRQRTRDQGFKTPFKACTQ